MDRVVHMGRPTRKHLGTDTSANTPPPSANTPPPSANTPPPRAPHPGARAKRRATGARAARHRRLRCSNSPRPCVTHALRGEVSGHFCYALMNNSGRTYVGYTVDPVRRLRQHNGELSGGAKRTRGDVTTSGGSWTHLFVVAVESPAFDAHQGLSLEWHLKRVRGAEHTRGAERRLQCLRGALAHPKFAPFLEHMVVFVHPRYLNRTWALLQDLLYPIPCMLSLDEWIDG
jgi:predicted GIY-YIG superfamily endonuclease